MSTPRRFAELTQNLADSTSPRAKSLIVTIYGDAIAPHGGTVWLGSLIRLVEPLGLNERLVRTAVLRLSRDSWLSANQIGRRSYYSLTESGRRRFEDAHRRIYSVPRAAWNGRWTLAVLVTGAITNASRDRLRRELTWLGFGTIGANCMAHPDADIDAVRHVLQDQGVADGVVLLDANDIGGGASPPLLELVRQCWDIEQLEDGYRGFLERFRPLLQSIHGNERPDPQSCFLIRTLLIHEYRRVLLRDPQLPDELLQSGWSGTAARLLCRNLYRLTQHPAERHLMSVLETADGPLPEAAPYFFDRFGGLEDASVAVRESA
ncbi:MAG: phenylacetic acid degradation operon negative regulatory protein PaaX [Alphaproteobacteria bacterium]|nr:phenylacetic acid degradation operon negative regulatory protein PaaX [Alphaproteobacteria bacterium]